ncbi:MAG: hypothetical protein ABIP94_03395 [Planctomycetota bacterium]
MAAGRSGRRLLLAGLLAVSAAWMVAKMVWPEQEDATSTLNYVMAVELATEPNRDDLAYRSAIGRIADHCIYAADVIRQLGTQAAEPRLAQRATQIASELIDLLTNGPRTPSGPVDLRLLESTTTASDPSQPLLVRLQALDHLGQLTSSGLTAMLLSPMVDADSNTNRRNWVEELLEHLRD